MNDGEDELLFEVEIEAKNLRLSLPAKVFYDVRKIDRGSGRYWEVGFVGERGYVAHSPEFEAELRRLGQI